MKSSITIRYCWLKIMYILTLVVAGGGGIGILMSPEFTLWLLNDTNSRMVSGIVGSVYLAMGILSIFGLRNPIRFAPVLLVQLFYKTLWIICIALPLIIKDAFPNAMIPILVVFIIIILGDLIAIPFRLIFNKTKEDKNNNLIA